MSWSRGQWALGNKPGSITVLVGALLQTMAGFGGSDAFLDDTPFSDATADLFFSPTLGIGLSILRTGIAYDGTSMSFYSNATKAAARGAIVMAYPFTAPAASKDNDLLTSDSMAAGHGHLLVADYASWAATLAGFQATMVANGGPNIYAIAVQNEPDFPTPAYNSMVYTDAEMAAFIDVLGPALAALSPAPLLLAPEIANWPSNLAGYTAAIAGDSTAKAYTAIVSTHQYGGDAAPDGNLPALPIWQTEMSYFTTFDATMAQALLVAADIHSALTTGQVSAWVYWWLLRTSQTDNEGLTDTSTPTKRLYALGNWSKFVRPGYVRLGTTGSVSGCLVTAFCSGPAFVVVLVNTNATPVSFYVALSGLAGTTVTPWVTDVSNNLVAQTPVPIASGRFQASLTASSVTTFVGTGT